MFRLLLLMLLVVLQIVSGVEIHIDEYGVATVKIVTAFNEGLNVVDLPVDPIVETIEIALGNRTLVPIYEEGKLYVISPEAGTATITYLANISAEGGVLVLRVNSNTTVKLVLSPAAVLLTLPLNIVDAYYENSELIIVFQGPQTLEYTVREVTPTPSPTCLLYTSPSPRDLSTSRMPSSA